MEYSIAIKNKQHMEFFETISSFKDSTAFEEIYLMEYSIGMQKSKIWSSSMASSFKDSMINYKFYLMEYSIIMQRKRHMEFFKKKKKKKSSLHGVLRNLPHGVLHENGTNMSYGVLKILDILRTPCALQNFTPRSTPSKKKKKMQYGVLKNEHY